MVCHLPISADQLVNSRLAGRPPDTIGTDACDASYLTATVFPVDPAGNLARPIRCAFDALH
ncbi:hypothetical protein [Nocardia sp. NPDC058480]|uniref:hypothetical protein n=1 Tax=unclassified Nocardia TaxID=2637762 RepID=UPI00366181EB